MSFLRAQKQIHYFNLLSQRSCTEILYVHISSFFSFCFQDWLRANIVAVLVLLINMGLAFLFINLMNNAGYEGPGTSESAILSPEDKLAAASAAEEAVKKAMRAANAAVRPR